MGPRNSFGEAEAALTDAFNAWQDFKKPIDKKNEEDQRAAAEQFYANYKGKSEWNDLVKQRLQPQGADPFFQDHLGSLIMHEAGLEYQEALNAQAPHVGRAVNPDTNELLPLQNLDAIHEKTAEPFMNNAAMGTKGGSLEWARMKILAQREFKRQVSKIHADESQKYYEFLTGQNVAKALNDYRLTASGVVQNVNKPGWIDQLASLEDAQTALNSAVKTAGDNAASFAGLNYRNIITGAVEKFMNDIDPREAQGMLPALMELPIGGTTFGKDPQIGLALNNIQNRLGKLVRAEDRADRVEHRNELIDQVDQWKTGAYSEMAAAYAADPNKSVQPILQKWMASIPKSGLSGQMFQQAAAELIQYRNTLAAGSDIGDPLAERQKAAYAKEVENAIRHGKTLPGDHGVPQTITPELIDALDIREQDKARLYQVYQGVQDGMLLTEEAGLSRLDARIKNLAAVTQVPGLQEMLKDEDFRISAEAMRLASEDGKTVEERTTNVREYISEQSKLIATKYGPLQKQMEGDRAAIQKEIAAAQERYLPARDLIEKAAANKLLNPSEIARLQSDDDKNNDPFQFSGVNGVELHNKMLNALSRKYKGLEGLENFASEAVGKFTGLWATELDTTKKNQSIGRDQIQQKLKTSFDRVFNQALSETQSMVDQYQKGEAGATLPTPLGESIKHSRNLDTIQNGSAIAAVGENVKSFFLDDYTVNAEHYTPELRGAINRAVNLYRSSNPSDLTLFNKNAKSVDNPLTAIDDALILAARQANQRSAMFTGATPMWAAMRRLVAMRGLTVDDLKNGSIVIYPSQDLTIPETTRELDTSSSDPYFRVYKTTVKKVQPPPIRIELKKLAADIATTPIFGVNWDDKKEAGTVLKAFGVPSDLEGYITTRQKMLTSERGAVAAQAK